MPVAVAAAAVEGPGRPPVDAVAQGGRDDATIRDPERGSDRAQNGPHPVHRGPGPGRLPAAITARDVEREAWPGAPVEEHRPSCTVAQLRRFIKSRPWVPMHELRRRFGINGGEDDVTPIRVGDQRLYIGLPTPEGRLVAELLSGGDVGYELSLDPDAPVVVGVYPMRPVPRG